MPEKYIATVENQFCITGYEYYIFEDTQIKTTHKPDFATTFPNNKACREAIDKFCAGHLKQDGRVHTLSHHMKRWDVAEENDFFYRTFPLRDEEANIMYDPKKHTKEDVLDWHIRFREKMSTESKMDQEVYNSWPELYSTFKYIFQITGYYSEDRDSDQLLIKPDIRTERDGDFQEFKKEFDLIKDRSTKTVEKAGDEGKLYKTFNIFDHSCGTLQMNLCYLSDNDCWLGSRCYAGFSGTLEECFNLMKKEYYYE